MHAYTVSIIAAFTAVMKPFSNCSSFFARTKFSRFFRENDHVTNQQRDSRRFKLSDLLALSTFEKERKKSFSAFLTFRLVNAEKCNLDSMQ